MNRILASGTPLTLSLLRLMSGLLLLQHGTQKILSFPTAPARAPDFSTIAGWSGPIELVCGILLTIGLFTRPAAFLASGFAASAYFMVHAPRGFYPLLNGGELAALYCFVFFYLAFAGGGPISLDAKLRHK